MSLIFSGDATDHVDEGRLIRDGYANSPMAEGEPTIADVQQLLALEDICGKRLRVVRIAAQMHQMLNSSALWPAQVPCFSEMLLGADREVSGPVTPAGSQAYNRDIDCSFWALLADVSQGIRRLLRRYIPLVQTRIR